MTKSKKPHIPSEKEKAENLRKARFLYSLMCQADADYHKKVSFGDFYTQEMYHHIQHGYTNLLNMINVKIEPSQTKRWKKTYTTPTFWEKCDRDKSYEPRMTMGNKPYALVKGMNKYHPSGDLVITYLPKKDKPQ